MLLVAAVVGSILFSTRHNRVELNGTAAPGSNPGHRCAKYRCLSRYSGHESVHAAVRRGGRAGVIRTGRVGSAIPGDTFSETDAQRLFTYYPVLGKKYNPEPDDPPENQPRRDDRSHGLGSVSRAAKNRFRSVKASHHRPRHRRRQDRDRREAIASPDCGRSTRCSAGRTQPSPSRFPDAGYPRTCEPLPLPRPPARRNKAARSGQPRPPERSP